MFHDRISVLKTVAIAVSANVYNKLGGVGSVGGIIGMSSFIFLYLQ